MHADIIGEHDDETIKNRPLEGQSETRSAELEAEAISVAESEKNYSKALSILNESINTCPTYPSPHNNRAQVRRLILSAENKNSLKEEKEIMDDLNAAINLCKDEFPVVKRLALCQRASIHYGKGDNEAAFRDFEAAAKLGSKVGRRMATACNPYARLCNNIMQQMLQSLYFSNPSAK